MQYCSSQHRTLLLSPVTSTTGCYFCFGSIPSFFLKLFLHWSPVAYWVPTDLGSSSSSVLSFRLFILFIGFSRQEYWSGLPLPSPVDHILSDLSTMTHPSWVAPSISWYSHYGKQDESESKSRSVVSDSPWNFPGQNTGRVIVPFSRGSSQPRDQTPVSCIAGRFFTIWTT